MRNEASRTWIALGLLLGGFPVAASPAAAPLPPVPAELDRLDWMVGEWEGSGWIPWGGRRGEFTGTERVERRMGGRLAVVEGVFRANIERTADDEWHEVGRATRDGESWTRFLETTLARKR